MCYFFFVGLEQMFGQVQIKQEYSGSEDNSQNGTNGVQTAPDYSGFTNQDVEYMYRQLPQFWGQNQIPTLHIPDDIPSKSDHQPRSSMSHQTSVRTFTYFVKI